MKIFSSPSSCYRSITLSLNKTAESRGSDPPGITKRFRGVQTQQLAIAYDYQTEKTLKNDFLLISKDAIDAVLSSKHNFTDAFHVLSHIKSQRPFIDGHGAGKFAEIPSEIKVFLKKDRAKESFRLSNKILIQEVDAIRRNMQRVNPREQRERPQDLHVDIVMVLEFGVMIALVSLVFQLCII